jgi:predicted regulator of Ras-like GTPase activity (Roadblock/LC7/MglB family)
MNLTLPLAELVAKVDGAFGAILADSDGEAVSVYALPDQAGAAETGGESYVGNERIKLIGAYQTITLRACCQLTQRFNTGAVTHLVCHFDTATILIKALKNNYALMLALHNNSNVGQGMLYLDQTADLISQDL